MRFLIVDDNPKSSLRLKGFLEEEAFAVDHATSGTRGMYLARIKEYNLLIINQTEPGDFVYTVCAELRASGCDIPIICVLPNANLERRLRHFAAGADDCLAHPLSFREILARIRVILRRLHALSPNVLTASGVVLDTRAQCIRVGRKTVALSKKEFLILELLMKHKGTIVTRSVLVEHVWQMRLDASSNSLESHIFSLRRKLGQKGKVTIRSVQGRGYVLD